MSQVPLSHSGPSLDHENIEPQLSTQRTTLEAQDHVPVDAVSTLHDMQLPGKLSSAIDNIQHSVKKAMNLRQNQDLCTAAKPITITPWCLEINHGYTLFMTNDKP